MNDIKSKEEEADLEERAAPRSGDRKAQRGEGKGWSRWAELVHSLGLPQNPMREGLLTKEGQPDDDKNL
jgi:hypothetical protein